MIDKMKPTDPMSDENPILIFKYDKVFKTWYYTDGLVELRFDNIVEYGEDIFPGLILYDEKRFIGMMNYNIKTIDKLVDVLFE